MNGVAGITRFPLGHTVVTVAATITLPVGLNGITKQTECKHVRLKAWRAFLLHYSKHSPGPFDKLVLRQDILKKVLQRYTIFYNGVCVYGRSIILLHCV